MLDNIVKTIINAAKSAVPQAIDAAQRNELVVNTLKKLKLDPTQPPKDVDGVYIYALVEYGVGKDEAILKLFREKQIKNDFWSAYSANSPISFWNKVDDFIESYALGMK
ncbi:MAG: hypothetical protein F6K08_19375 [Okeania sp. SIO1H6]|nr:MULTISPECIES: hypothetical protein [unclassified Okeania]NES78187.1 hypothetical protein [Okeania sp. SIO1H4]NET14838.1 hypothetical protein [Okeania sp. SIO1H6]NET18751.1 hypothetical protein [Okeania sp. SIO1H5]NET96225.1 hypothetical protein [Okeania sp. SIO1H2]